VQKNTQFWDLHFASEARQVKKGAQGRAVPCTGSEKRLDS